MVTHRSTPTADLSDTLACSNRSFDPATFLVALDQGRPFDQELEEVGKKQALDSAVSVEAKA